MRGTNRTSIQKASPGGFTLLECGVCLLIGALILAAAVPGYSKFRSSMDLRNAVTQIKGDLRLSQRTSVTRRYQRVLAFGTPDQASYTILEDLNSDRRAGPGEEVRTLSLPGSVRFADISLAPRDSVIYTPTGMLANPGDGGTLTLENSRGRRRSLRLWSSGSVEILD